MSTAELIWPELRTANRRLLDACIQQLAAHPIAYRSPEWTALPDIDPAKHHATVRAANAWHAWWKPAAVAARQAAEADALDRAVSDRIHAAARAIATGRRWHLGATAAELHRRRYPWLYPDWQRTDWPGTDRFSGWEAA